MMQNQINRREFIQTSSSVLGTGALLGSLPGIAFSAESDDPLMRHRFGLNYVPSQNWYFCWNDWKPDNIARDFDSIAAIGADHIRIMLIWPWFQPNPTFVSPAHLDRLEELMSLASERKLDVMVTLFTGQLSSYHFNPPYLEKELFYASPKWMTVQELYVSEVSKRMLQHSNFLGYDIGNEINTNWSCKPEVGDLWMERVFNQMRALCPGRVHVNGVDQVPWFTETTFSPQALVAQQEIVSLHCWPYWTGARKYGSFFDKPSTELQGAMAALARSFGNAPRKPIRVQEFGMKPDHDMPEADIPRWVEAAIPSGISGGVSWFTWWASHDVDKKFYFADVLQYPVGLITGDNKIKEQGQVFKKLADTYRGKPVVIPSTPLPPPPAHRTNEATWKWMLDWMGWKAI